MNKMIVIALIAASSIAFSTARPQTSAATGTGTSFVSGVGTPLAPFGSPLAQHNPAFAGAHGGIAPLPVAGLGSPFAFPQFLGGSGSASGAGTGSAGAGGVSASGVAISNAQNGGTSSASGTGTASENVFTGQASASGTGQSSSVGK